MAMRRPNGSGSIVKLSGRRRRPYAVRVFDGIEITPQGNGIKKYKYLGYFEKQGDALRFLEKFNSSPVTLASAKQGRNKHKFSEILHKILQIYDRIIFEFYLSFIKIYCFETLRP